MTHGPTSIGDVRMSTDGAVYVARLIAMLDS